MKAYILLIFTFLVFTISSVAQNTKYIIRFSDKSGSPHSLLSPGTFLSQKSIDRRAKQHIAIEYTDLPLSPAYLDSVKSAGNVSILNVSRWLNQVSIETDDDQALEKIKKFPFVLSFQPAMQPLRLSSLSENKLQEEMNRVSEQLNKFSLHDVFNYGNSGNQIRIHEGEFLHNTGFHGEGMTIAILDAGFYHYQSLPAFDSVRINQQILGTYDFVKNEVSVDEDHPHGMQCFSIIAANLPGQLVGSSPKANYYLFRTEDGSSESIIEEHNWAAGAELADSLGCDVISTSLGYSTFDNPAFNHTYADMDGNTTMAARAADMAARKGMIVVVSAGNAGNNAWHYIATPADADSIVAVGAIDSVGKVAAFSSFGPSADGQIKPTVASVGVRTALQSPDGRIVGGNGTSFAAPNMAGLITCLWQAFPDFTNMEIIEAVKKSSDKFDKPDDRSGFGIPNFRVAFNDLSQQYALRNAASLLSNNLFKIYPNPVRESFTVLIKPTQSGNAKLRLINSAGQVIISRFITTQAGQIQIIKFEDLNRFTKGFYILQYLDDNNKVSQKVIVD